MLSSTTSGLGFKSIAGSTGWGNYVLDGDVRMNQIGPNGNAGLVFRVTDPDPDLGIDALNGYYVGVAAGNVILGRMNYSWAQLPPSAAIPGGAPAGTWIHLRVKVTGCTIEISAKRWTTRTRHRPSRRTPTPRATASARSASGRSTPLVHRCELFTASSHS